ncbi:hypothetical protein LCL97_07890 [Seohaeicola saemankumensis]|nr:hypothetical protein [Seohaeicola saemankumensis]MCA0870740.1 hypothetical protein [Seohaeicola saemankumensis]
MILPVLAIAWMVYRDLRHTDWSGFGFCLGVLFSTPAADFFLIEALLAEIWAGAGLRSAIFALLAQLGFGLVGLVIERQMSR